MEVDTILCLFAANNSILVQAVCSRYWSLKGQYETLEILVYFKGLQISAFENFGNLEKFQISDFRNFEKLETFGCRTLEGLETFKCQN